MVITSRMADYEGVGGSGFREAELLPFTVEDTHAYISSWGLGENAQAQLVDALRNPALASMARVPHCSLCYAISFQRRKRSRPHEPAFMSSSCAGFYAPSTTPVYRKHSLPALSAALSANVSNGSCKSYARWRSPSPALKVVGSSRCQPGQC